MCRYFVFDTSISDGKPFINSEVAAPSAEAFRGTEEERRDYAVVFAGGNPGAQTLTREEILERLGGGPCYSTRP